MKKLFVIFILAAGLTSCIIRKTVNQNSATAALSSERDAETIKQLEYDAISAEFRLDTAAIAPVLHHNFIAVYPHKLQNKQQELSGIYKNITQRKKEGETMDSLYLDDFRAQFYNNTAIVTFHTVTRGTRKGVRYAAYMRCL